MAISNYFQLTLLVLAGLCFCWTWRIPTPYGGDAGLGDALAKGIGYGTTGLLVTVTIIWFIIQHIQFR